MLLMDEPFGALDPVTRVELRREFTRIQQQLKTTVILVTHDMAEAFTLAGRIGVVDAGALVVCDTPAAIARSSEPRVKVLVLDSVVMSPNNLLRTAVSSCVGLDNGLVQSFSRVAMKTYMLGGYDAASACEFAGAIRDQKVMLLSGTDAGALRDATAALQQCFPSGANVEVRTDLPTSGFGLPSVTGEQGEAYDRVVIEFFARNLR